MTMDVYSLNYLHHLNDNIYSQFTNTKIYAYPNILLPKHKGKKVTQYHFRSRVHPLFTALHSLWYKWDSNKNKFIKIVPLNIEEYLTPLALAIWFMDDGSKLEPGVRIATNNFTLNEVQFLCDILYKKYNLIATVHSGGKDKGFVLYINKKSVPLFISLVKIYMHPSLYYKLGIVGK